MEQKELIITPPEGYEIDKENSTLGHIRFKKIEKPEPKTYKEVAELLLKGKTGYFTDANGNVTKICKLGNSWAYPNTAPTQEQLEWLIALNKLQNVANYLNDDWKPDWTDGDSKKYLLSYCEDTEYLGAQYSYTDNFGDVYFKSRELALKAIEILGEEVVKTALGVYKGC